MTAIKGYVWFKAAAISLILLLLLSCGSKSKKYIVSEKKFLPFLVDLHLAEAIAMESRGDRDLVYEIDSASLYGSVFEKHGITSAMFDSTMYYYSLRPEKLQRIFNNVTAELKRREEELASMLKEEELAQAEIIWQSDSVYRFPPGGADRIEIDVPIKGPAIYAVSANVKILPDDASLDPRMSLYFYNNDSTRERLRFQEIRYTSRNGEDKTYRAVKRLESPNFTHIRGYILNYTNTDSVFQRNALVKDILITRRPLPVD